MKKIDIIVEYPSFVDTLNGELPDSHISAINGIMTENNYASEILTYREAIGFLTKTNVLIEKMEFKKENENAIVSFLVKSKHLARILASDGRLTFKKLSINIIDE